MASDFCLHLPDPEDDVVPHRHDQTETLNFLHYHDFHFFSSSGPDLPHQEDDVPLPDSLIVDGPDLFDRRENQVNFVIDLFHQRVDQSNIISNNILGNNTNSSNHHNAFDLVSDALFESDSGVIEGNHELDLRLALGFDSMDTRESDMEIDICGGDDDHEHFFVERRVSGTGASEAASSFSGVENFGDSISIVGLRSDSDDEVENGNDNEALTIDLNSGDDFGIDVHVNDGYDFDVDDTYTSFLVPLFCDSLQLEDCRETNEDFEWEEVDGRDDEREVLSMVVDLDDDENSVSLSISPIIAPEDAVHFERLGTEWEVLLNDNTLVETNPEMDENAVRFFADQDDYTHTAEYEMLFGQFAENEVSFIGRPAASKFVVENLPSVVVTQEVVRNNNAPCAVCKDEFNFGETMKLLPCAHRYHGDCIIPWLAIRNTCPVCRHELPTDDADYERRSP